MLRNLPTQIISTAWIVLVAMATISLVGFIPVFAQSGSVQEIHGYLDVSEIDVYLLPGMKAGQTIYATLQTTSGNLDPALALVENNDQLKDLVAGYNAELQQLIASSPHPLVELPALRDRYFLAWDDDSGPGYAAAMQYTLPKDGDYLLLVTGSLSAAGRKTYGDYQLVIGVDVREVLSGAATPAGAPFAFYDETSLGKPARIQETTGSLGPDKPTTTILLENLNPGDTLSIYLETTAGNITPTLVLRDYGQKPLRVGNLNNQAQQTSLSYAFPEGGKNYSLQIVANKEGDQVASGEYRLLTGVNAPEVLEGSGEPNSDSVLRLPTEVKVGLKLQQIVSINQADEIMNAVGALKMEWTDPALAFSPDTCDCSSKLYTENSFNKFLDDVKGRWPDFTFFNQQANRWTQNRIVEILPDGRTTYIERFTTNFQLNFDYTRYPLDTQDFYIHIDQLASEDQYKFSVLENFSEIDPENGEDEFILSAPDTQISSEISSRVIPTSRFTFHFQGPRHLEYYIFRIFIPVLLIIIISYITFFLKDYTRRIEVATGNILLFIAFSFSLAENYPRQGYLTFLDAIMAVTFVINALTVIYNVYLKWLESNGQRERADRIDRVGDWVYPISYLASFGLIWFFFLR